MKKNITIILKKKYNININKIHHGGNNSCVEIYDKFYKIIEILSECNEQIKITADKITQDIMNKYVKLIVDIYEKNKSLLLSLYRLLTYYNDLYYELNNMINNTDIIDDEKLINLYKLSRYILGISTTEIKSYEENKKFLMELTQGKSNQIGGNIEIDKKLDEIKIEGKKMIKMYEEMQILKKDYELHKNKKNYQKIIKCYDVIMDILLYLSIYIIINYNFHVIIYKNFLVPFYL